MCDELCELSNLVLIREYENYSGEQLIYMIRVKLFQIFAFFKYYIYYYCLYRMRMSNLVKLKLIRNFLLLLFPA